MCKKNALSLKYKLLLEINGWIKIFIFIGIVAAWYGLLRILPVDIWLFHILTWIKDSSFWGPIIFVLLYLPFCILMLPDFLPNAAAGAIWGVGVGSAVVSCGRVLGSAVTFLLARRVAKNWIERRMVNDDKFAAVSRAIEREGFRIVFLVRLCPLFPSIVLN